MKRTSFDQKGFIPLLLTILLIVAGIIYLIFTRVMNASN